MKKAEGWRTLFEHFFIKETDSSTLTRIMITERMFLPTGTVRGSKVTTHAQMV